LTRPFFASTHILGVIEEVDISRIRQGTNPVRFSIGNATNNMNLAKSIKQQGLLQPILIRANTSNFEIVAGNRRFQACKMLGYRKIACHIVELDDKASYEVALVENLQRRTLTPIEEAHAFKNYVTQHGYGSITDLAEKLSKSVSYITKRIKLLELPPDILDSINSSMMSASTAEELFTLKDGDKQSRLAQLISDRHLSLKKVRDLVKEETIERNDFYEDRIWPCHVKNNDRTERAQKSFDKTIIILRIAMAKLGTVIEGAEDDWVIYDTLMQHKNMLNSQIDLLIKAKKRKIPS
jgi:ParB family chromosome partitioning protein